MEVKVRTADLVAHRKRFLLAKLNDKIAEAAKVTLRAAEKLSVESLGFREDLSCKPIQWGTVSLPYLLWENLIKNLVPVLKEEEITIRAERYHLQFGTTGIEHSQIQVSHMDGVSLEIPPGAEPIDIVLFAATKEMKVLRRSESWLVVKKAIKLVKGQITRATTPIRKYGVSREDVAQLLARKLGIEKPQRFLDTVFVDERRRI